MEYVSRVQDVVLMDKWADRADKEFVTLIELVKWHPENEVDNKKIFVRKACRLAFTTPPSNAWNSKQL